jgi:DNA-binding transcriptional ArsR family regulator
MVELTLVNWDYVMFIVISFSITAIFTILYNKDRHQYTSKVDVKEPIIEAVVAEYSRKLKYIENTLVELRIQIDNLESRTRPSDTASESYTHHITSHQKSQVPKEYITSVSSEHTSPVVEPIAPVITQNSMQDMQNGTMEYILKLLNERPRSSREIQSSIGRTREHTSRLMKRLYEAHLVDRQSNSRPYKYTITHAGRVKINVQSGKDSSSENENIPPHMIDVHSRLQHNNTEYQR